MELYLRDTEGVDAADIVRKSLLLGCIRIMDFLDRHNELPDSESCLKVCARDIKEALQNPDKFLEEKISYEQN